MLKHRNQAFELKYMTKKEQQLEAEVGQLKAIIAELAVELKNRISAQLMKRQKSESIIQSTLARLEQIKEIETDHPL